MNLAKANLILAITAAVLAIPTTYTLIADASMFKSIDEVPKLFPGLTLDNIGVVLIAKPKAEQPAPQPTSPNPAEQKPPVQYDSLAMKRGEKGWEFAQGELQGAPVQTDRLEKMLLQHLQDIRYDRDVLVAEDASDEVLLRYGLDEAHALVIKAADKTGQTVVAELLVGKDASAGKQENVRGFYMRRKDGKDVVLYEGQFNLPDIKSEYWIDRKLQQLEPGKLVRFSYQGPGTDGRVVEFERVPGSQASWSASKAPDGVGAVRQQEVENMVQQFCYVSVQDYKGPLQGANLGELGLVPPRLTVTAVVNEKAGEQNAAEQTYTLAIGNKVDDRGEFYAQSNQSHFLLTLPQGKVAPFERDAKDLFDPPAPKEVPDAPKAPEPGKQPDDKK